MSKDAPGLKTQTSANIRFKLSGYFSRAVFPQDFKTGLLKTMEILRYLACAAVEAEAYLTARFTGNTYSSDEIKLKWHLQVLVQILAQFYSVLSETDQCIVPVL